jgi:hypothetical protein
MAADTARFRLSLAAPLRRATSLIRFADRLPLSAANARPKRINPSLVGG